MGEDEGGGGQKVVGPPFLTETARMPRSVNGDEWPLWIRI
jgi:hypothetical protein